MKVALLLPGYLDSPDYLHMLTFEQSLLRLGYTVERLDPCHLWENGDVSQYTVTNCIRQVQERVGFYAAKNPKEIVLIGHSMGGFTAIIAGNRIPDVTKIVALCPPPDRKESVKKWKNGGVRVSQRDLPDNPHVYREFAIPYSYVTDALKYSTVEEVKSLHKPLMIFIALEDETVPPKLTEQIVAHANNPYVIRQPNMGHSFRRSQEACDLVMKGIEKFLLQSD